MNTKNIRTAEYNNTISFITTQLVNISIICLVLLLRISIITFFFFFKLVKCSTVMLVNFIAFSLMHAKCCKGWKAGNDI